MQPRRRIILLIEASSAYGRGCMRGISRYARTHGGWVFFHRMRFPAEPIPLQTLRDWDADGVIARVDNVDVERALRELGLPTVDLNGAIAISGVPTVYPDHRKVIAMAVEHLVGNGLEHIAFCGYPGVSFSDTRQRMFEEMDLPHQGKLVFRGPASSEILSYDQRGLADAKAIASWLLELPKPVGVVACCDTRGRHVLDACEAADLRVPYDVSVVGIDDDDVVCELSEPRLTSVVPNLEATGFEAARMLDQLIEGRPCPLEPVLVPPIAIECRDSSDVTALGDPSLIAAVRYIRGRVGDGINVEDVVAHAAISRSTLERQFEERLRCTPHEFILRCRIERVKQLLLDTDYPLNRIAPLAGFRRVSHMITVFRAKIGQTPAAFRTHGSTGPRNPGGAPRTPIAVSSSPNRFRVSNGSHAR